MVAGMNTCKLSNC